MLRQAFAAALASGGAHILNRESESMLVPFALPLCGMLLTFLTHSGTRS